MPFIWRVFFNNRSDYLRDVHLADDYDTRKFSVHHCRYFTLSLGQQTS